MANNSRLSSILTAYRSTIMRCARDWGEYEGLDSEKIIRWIDQFADEDHQLAVKILNEIFYLSREDIRDGVKEVVREANQRFNSINRNRILFVPIGQIYEGSAIIARALRDEIGENNIKVMTDLEQLQDDTYNALVFVDDFSGTGGRIKSWWDISETLIRPRGVPFAIALLVTNYIAKPVIEQFSDLISIHELTIEDKVISTESKKFTDDEKESIIEYCTKIADYSKVKLGFGNCGLLVAFKHGCPNNSLPIIWYDNCDDWEALFSRSAL